MSSWMQAHLAASTTSRKVECGRAKRMASSIVLPERNTPPAWETYAKTPRSCSSGHLRISVPQTRILPSSTSNRRESRLWMVVFPEPAAHHPQDLAFLDRQSEIANHLLTAR